MRITWDAPLVAAVGRELDARLEGARLRAVQFEYRARRLRLHFREHTLLALLHPEESGLILLDPLEPSPDARPLAARLRAVETAPDDRVLILQFLRVRGSPVQADVILELMGNQWNAVQTEGPERTVRHLLRETSGSRELRTGHPWPPTPPSTRAGALEPVDEASWTEALLEPAPERRVGALLSGFAWTSRLNAPALLGEAARPGVDPGAARAALEAGWTLWRGLAAVARGDAPADPVILAGPRGAQPYPLPLPGVEHEATPSLLEALGRVADRGEAAAAALIPGEWIDALEARVARTRARVASLEEEAAGLPDPAYLRALGDLLLARFHEVPPGEARAVLTGFDGEPVTVDLDPAAPVDANARAYYDRAGRAERAGKRLPALIARARKASAEAESLLERARAGEVDLDEVEDFLPERGGAGDGEGPTLPYRSFRSSGGLEIRVGRGAKRNDDLTFHYSAPDDVWLHARHAAGAHVILRWTRDGNPPARDLAEAAILAALHSKARTSGSVPVDWTRRKYVRKPRKAPPGAVVPERIQTLFVEPDPSVEDRLRVD